MKHHIDNVGGTVVDPPEFFMCTLVSELDEKIKHSVPAIDRSKDRSHELFHAKKSGAMPWNRTILRFNWHKLNADEYQISFDRNNWPEASEIVARSLALPPKKAAFGRKFWGIDEEMVHESDQYCE